MFELEELLLDGNKLKVLPAFLGNFLKLKHLDASFNQLELVCQELGKCSNLVDLTLSSNDLKVRELLNWQWVILKYEIFQTSTSALFCMFLLWATEQLWMMFLIKTEVNCTPKTSPPSFYETEAIFLTNYFHIKIWSDENLHNILAGHDLLKLLVSVNYALQKIVIGHV